MKCLVLAAGYATRLYPLTENFPKPLLKVGSKNILEHLLDDLTATGELEQFYVVTNAKFAPIFRDWAATRPENLDVVDDGTSTNETRLGAVRDIIFAIESRGIDDDLLILAGDNLLDFSLASFLKYAKEKGASCGMRYYEPDMAKLRKAGVAEIGDDDRILAMTEKPQEPKSHWCTPPFYFYRREDLDLVKSSVDAGCGVDAPGSLLAWMATKAPVYAYLMPGARHDIGDLESYKKAQQLFEERGL